MKKAGSTYTVKEARSGRYVVLHGKWNKPAFSKLLESEFEGVHLDTQDEWKPQKDLSFLEGENRFERLFLRAGGRLDIGAISSLTCLKRLFLKLADENREELDLSRMKALRRLECIWCPAFKGMENLTKLEELSLSGLRKTKELDLSGLKSLKRLEIIGGRTLERIKLAGAGQIEKLILTRLPKLTTVESFESGPVTDWLVVRGVKKMCPEFWKSFTNLRVVEMSRSEKLTKEMFGKPPNGLLKLP